MWTSKLVWPFFNGKVKHPEKHQQHETSLLQDMLVVTEQQCDSNKLWEWAASVKPDCRGSKDLTIRADGKNNHRCNNNNEIYNDSNCTSLISLAMQLSTNSTCSHQCPLRITISSSTSQDFSPQLALHMPFLMRNCECIHRVLLSTSVCLSVCPSVKHVHCDKTK